MILGTWSKRIPALGRRCFSGTLDCDIVVAGGGLVGAATARSLALNPALKDKSIVVLEGAPAPPAAQPVDNAPAEYNNRVIALNNSSKDLFTRIGVWDTIRDARVKTVSGMHVWDSRNDARNSTLVSFEAESSTQSDRGHFYIAENDLVVRVLMQAAAQCPNVEIRYGTSAVRCQRDSDLTHITLKDGDTLATRLLVGADGPHSVVRKSMGKDRLLSKNYHQMGVVATLHLSEEIPNTHAWQKFLPTGPIALLPLSENRSSLVWTLPTARAMALLKSPEEQVLDELLRNLGPAPVVSEPFPSIGKVTNVAGFPLGLGLAIDFCQEGMVILGDAAHRVHPLAGQGVNLGFGDVECLTRCLERNVLDGARFGTKSYLIDYESERIRQNAAIMAGIDFFHTVYGSDNAVLAAARKAGIGIVNSSPVLKKALMSFAA